jgi:hypothetical protein
MRCRGGGDELVPRRRSGAGLGDHLDAAPHLGLAGRIEIAKPVRSYLPAISEMSVAGWQSARLQI